MSPSRYTRTTPVSPNRRVVVTGVGGVTPVGLSMEESWKNILAGKSGISKITHFDPTEFDTQIAGEVKGFNPDPYIHKKDQKKMDLFIQYAMASAQMAIADAKLTFDEELGSRTGCIVGAGMGGLPSIEDQSNRLREGKSVSAFFIPMCIANLAAGQISIKHGLQGPNYSVTSACASGAHAIGEAARYIRDGLCDVMVAGGAEGTVCRMSVAGFGSMHALSKRNDAPEEASRPFDQHRDGFVIAEGAAILILESLEHAEKRGAPILCELTGYGVSSDAYHMTSPAPEGRGAVLAVRNALKDSGLNPVDIAYVNAHGTSTSIGDQMETQALKHVFGDHAGKLWVSSTKSMIGHTLGAAGAIESAFCVLALRDQIAPPTINLRTPSEGCDLDYVANEARPGKIRNALNNSFGFGGTNASLVFSLL